MPFLRAVVLKDRDELPEKFPFTVPAIRNLPELSFEKPVTFLVGENGCGKSTLLEGLAALVKAAAVGSGDIRNDPTLKFARELSFQLTPTMSRRPKACLFFRAEDFFGFVKRVIREKEELAEMEKEFERELSGHGQRLAMGTVRGQKEALARRYGENPDAFSHGESFLNLFQSRVVPNGLYLLDEPETPLSPLRQLAFLSLLKEMTAENSQFIIATHSPILMAFQDAAILNFADGKVSEVAYDDVEHVSLTRAFLKDPEAYLSKL